MLNSPRPLYLGEPSVNCLDRHENYLKHRHQEGCYNATRLWHELRAQGFRGGYGIVSQWVRHMRTARDHPARLPTTHDLVLTLADGHVIVCEHKLGSPETPGETASEEQECAPVCQLERYLKLPGVHGVAYFRSWWQAPDEGVLNHPLYIRPSSGREHFLWNDLYESLVSGSGLVSQWLRESFEFLGFTPPHPSIGELEHPDEAVRVRVAKI